MSERLRMFTVERDGAVAGGPDGPMPVQVGDVVVVYVAKGWTEAAEYVRQSASEREAVAIMDAAVRRGR